MQSKHPLRMLAPVYRALALMLVVTFLVSACTSAATVAPTAEVVAQPADTSLPAVETPAAGGELAKVRIAVLPVLDALPMYVAQQEGLFAKHGVEVELIPAGSAPKRDELISAAQADGMINETLSVMFYNKEATQVQVVRFARTATADTPIFRVLSAAGSKIASPADMKNVEVGISQGTIIEYLTDRLLQGAGLAPEEIKTVAVPDIGQRMALLTSGELKAATMPDPLASLAIQQGATLIVDDTQNPEISHSVYTFRKAFIDGQPEAMRGFLAAIEEAVLMINNEPERWKSLLSDQKLVPPPILESFKLPQYPPAGVPNQEQWDDVHAWAKDKGLLATDVAYGTSVSAEYLPR